MYLTGLSSDDGRHLTTTKTCWNCDRMFLAQKGFASGSWNITVTMSLPMWRLRNNCIVTIINNDHYIVSNITFMCTCQQSSKNFISMNIAYVILHFRWKTVTFAIMVVVILFVDNAVVIQDGMSHAYIVINSLSFILC